MSRHPDWPERLAAYIAGTRSLPFAWGWHDCGTFAAGAVLVITGRDVRPDIWVDRRGAARLLRSAGGLAGVLDTALPRLAAPTLAQRGDVVLVHTPQRQWLAVCDGAVAWAPARAGLAAAPMALVTIAWGVR